jgi:hypothetical protein
MSGNPPSSSSGGSTGGGASGGFSGGGAGGGADPCVLRFETVLASPDPAEVAALSIGDVLNVLVQDSPPAVTACAPDGRIVGGITQEALRLRTCIQQGHAYDAKILSISGGAVQVQVHNA